MSIPAYDFQRVHGLGYTQDCLRRSTARIYRPEECHQVEHGLEVMRAFHGGQLRSDGSPYVVHPVRVALLLLEHEQPIECDTLIAALLHDALEDTELTEGQVELSFGRRVREYVVALTRKRPRNETHEQRKLSKMTKWKLIMGSCHEIRAIKTFDYYDNMISWKFISPNATDYRKIPRWLMAAETMYLPLAKTTNAVAYQLMRSELDYYLGQGYKVGDWHDG